MNSLEDLQNIFDTLPGNYLILRPDHPRFTIAYANLAYLKVTTSEKSIVGSGLFEVFTDNPGNPEATGVQNLNASLMEVIATKTPHRMKVQRYDIRTTVDSFEERYWQPINVPVIDDTGSISFIIHNVEDVTIEVMLRKRLQQGAQQNQRDLQNAVVTTQEIERMEVAKELHDNINQILLTSRLYLEHALNKHGADSTFLTSGVKLLEKAMLEIRLLSRSLFLPFSGEENLKSAIEQLAKHTASLRDIAIERDIDLSEKLIDTRTKQTVFRIVQEQINNVIKHSGAKKLRIAVRSVEKAIEIKIEDDGVGFNPAHNIEGIGFKSIIDRVQRVGGTLKIQAAEGMGCAIEARIPIPN